MKVEVRLVENLKFNVNVNEAHNVVVDADRIAAPSSMDYVLAGLGSCTSISIVSILKRMHEIITDFRVEIESEQASEPPRVFTKIKLKYIAYGIVDDNNLKKAIDLTFEKYSPTAVMLQRAGVLLEKTYELR
ncbi:MAG: OsmC family protein [Thermoplasmata archaeon]